MSLSKVMRIKVNFKREIIVFISLIAFSIFLLPALIYLVGDAAVGPFEGESGLSSLYGAILGGAARLQPAAWVLIAGPYVVIQSLRLAFSRRKAPAA